MDQPTDAILLHVAKTSQWQKAKGALITLAATMPVGSLQKHDLEEAIDQFVTYIEENQLEK